MPWTLSAFADEAGEPIEQQIAALHESKIRHVDLRNVDGFNITELPLDHAAAVRKKLDDAGIFVCMYGSPIGKMDISDDFAIDEKRMAHLGQLREVFGATYVRMFSYFNKNGASPQQWRQTAVERVKRLTELAGEYGLVLYHENEYGLYGGTHEAVCILRDEVHLADPNHFRLIFDFDNYNHAHEDVWENYMQQRETIHAIHLKESKWQPDGSLMHVPVGQGDGQIRRILTDLAERGWQGPLTLEPHLARSPAVLKTGPGGQANKALSSLSHHEVFVIAAEAARAMLKEIGRLEGD